MAVAVIIPFADMTIVLTHGGSAGTALGIHGLTAVLAPRPGRLRPGARAPAEFRRLMRVTPGAFAAGRVPTTSC
jgi:hypothetical protein